MTDVLKSLGILAVIVAALGGGNALMSTTGSGFYPEYIGHRFQSDNAPAATANAIEWMAEQRESKVAEWGIALICGLILLQLSRIAELLEANFRHPIAVVAVRPETKDEAEKRAAETVKKPAVKVSPPGLKKRDT